MTFSPESVLDFSRQLTKSTPSSPKDDRRHLNHYQCEARKSLQRRLSDISKSRLSESMPCPKNTPEPGYFTPKSDVDGCSTFTNAPVYDLSSVSHTPALKESSSQSPVLIFPMDDCLSSSREAEPESKTAEVMNQTSIQDEPDSETLSQATAANKSEGSVVSADDIVQISAEIEKTKNVIQKQFGTKTCVLQ